MTNPHTSPRRREALIGKLLARLCLILFLLLSFSLPTHAAETGDFDTATQLDALGGDELESKVPDEARELMAEAGVGELSVEALLELSPRDFFRAIWNAFVRQLQAPLRSFAAIAGVLLLCALLGGVGQASWDSALSQVFGAAAVLCVVLSVAKPILDCIVATTQAIRDASLFMVSFVPIFSAALMAAGQPVTGGTYNLFLFSTCQVVSQVVSQTLVPLLSIYLALCIVGAIVPEIHIASATESMKKVISWALGFVFTLFVALLSIQTMVSTGADGVTTRSAKFLISSFVPVVGSALSEAYTAAQGCLRLIKTCVGAYGMVAAVFIFLPVLLQALTWYVVTNLSVVVSDIFGVSAVSAVLKSCATVLGVLIGVILCYGLLMIVSTAVVMAIGMGTA
jgi:stage III sporulation protein AE